MTDGLHGVMMIHNFQKSLALSERYSDAPWWGEVYNKAFPNLATFVSVRDDGWAQRGGIDRVLTLKSGKVLTVDEKVRASDWPDILLEYWSDEVKQKRGWIAKDLACDFIAYAYIPSQTCYLLPFLTLRRAWKINCSDWVRDYPRIEAKNEGYITVSVAVPTEVLFARLTNAMIVKWDND